MPEQLKARSETQHATQELPSSLCCRGFWSHAQEAMQEHIVPNLGDTKMEMDYMFSNLLTMPSWGIITVSQALFPFSSTEW